VYHSTEKHKTKSPCFVDMAAESKAIKSFLLSYWNLLACSSNHDSYVVPTTHLRAFIHLFTTHFIYIHYQYW